MQGGVCCSAAHKNASREQVFRERKTGPLGVYSLLGKKIVLLNARCKGT